MESINRTAIELVDEALDFAGELDVVGYELDNGATVVDFGVDAAGGVEAGLLLAEIQTAGLANLQTRMGELAGAPRQYVELSTDHPAVALLCSQKAGWEITTEDGFEGLGSGPARALVGRETEFERVGYYDSSEFATLAVESTALPDEAVAEQVAELAEVDTDGVFLPAFATGSTAGSVTTAARAAELAVFRLLEIGYEPTDVLHASGSAPLAPATRDETEAMGRTNDALAYGGEVHLQVARDDDRFDEIVSTAGEEYGTPFVEVFEDADWDFYDVPESVFAPAQVTVDVVDGPVYTVGETDEELLAESFGYR
ncbi:methenyltetrahydromethanopterin cyclohydrolase [Halorubrum sp. SS5]|uniref:methenyltetrahydromethanopterin cyclohydrolase n=1 Tax=Halorubrum sp. SS7 TaxID=2518119 RepID=UPI0010F8D1AF|nr:methenyltetrahydromethanopterin cyclohydrolase [Halorubrum sp. SS7]TKX59021.1 methenyltetrahydromethanopterin cyclohydrolase [Halorubrum sp. SS7]TKX85852.1 methenyltetrahydromethanopterin cyclohydrolase [Halorubrum sp. SS5]